MRVTGSRASWLQCATHADSEGQGGAPQEGLERAAPLQAFRGLLEVLIEQIEEKSSTYVPSEGNTALLAQALGMPVGSLLTERDRLVERLPH
jgi:hypothetical protein